MTAMPSPHAIFELVKHAESRGCRVQRSSRSITAYLTAPSKSAYSPDENCLRGAANIHDICHHAHRKSLRKQQRHVMRIADHNTPSGNWSGAKIILDPASNHPDKIEAGKRKIDKWLGIHQPVKGSTP